MSAQPINTSEIPDDVLDVAFRIVESQRAEPFTLIKKISEAIMADRARRETPSEFERLCQCK